MARCGCAGSSCGCLLVAGANVTVTGVGSGTDPFVISAASAEITDVLAVQDTATINLTLLGDGTPGDPYILRGDTTMTMSELLDVNDPEGPANGDVPVWIGGGGGHWEFQTPPSGAVTVEVGGGISGDGTIDEPLAIIESGTWGTGVLDDWGSDDEFGAEVYVDSSGALRTEPDFKRCTSDDRPPAYEGLRIYEMDTGASFIGNGSTFEPLVVGIEGVYDPLTPVSISGTHALDAGLVERPGVVRITLTANTDITMPDGLIGVAYPAWLDVTTGGFTLEIGGTELAGVASASRVLIPMFWAGDAWFVQWPGA